MKINNEDCCESSPKAMCGIDIVDALREWARSLRDKSYRIDCFADQIKDGTPFYGEGERVLLELVLNSRHRDRNIC
jgi:hypothetical protein